MSTLEDIILGALRGAAAEIIRAHFDESKSKEQRPSKLHYSRAIAYRAEYDALFRDR